MFKWAKVSIWTLDTEQVRMCMFRDIEIRDRNPDVRIGSEDDGEGDVCVGNGEKSFSP